MSLALKFGDLQAGGSDIKGIIYFDAVTVYTKDYSGKVTSHPIEAGASISDHFVSDNPKFKISGVLSHVDWSPVPEKISGGALDGEVTNLNIEPEAVQTSNLGSGLR